MNHHHGTLLTTATAVTVTVTTATATATLVAATATITAAAVVVVVVEHGVWGRLRGGEVESVRGLNSSHIVKHPPLKLLLTLVLLLLVLLLLWRGSKDEIDQTISQVAKIVKNYRLLKSNPTHQKRTRHKLLSLKIKMTTTAVVTHLAMFPLVKLGLLNEGKSTGSLRKNEMT
jgi:hypothetical protein